MSILGKIFTWWDGATVGTLLNSWSTGTKVGEDSLGNRYFRAKKGSRRWVLYNGSNDASRVPPEWHGWLHHMFRDPPSKENPLRRAWQAPHEPNATGTSAAYLPPGHALRGGARKRATGDYEAWTPN